MSLEIARLQSIADAIAVDLRTVVTTKASPTAPVPQAALIRAVASIETLVGLVRGNEALWRGTSTSTVQRLEAQYGNTLGRLIAALGGLPVSTRARNDSLTRLLATDATARAELAHIDPHDSELLEVLVEIFVAESTPPSSASSTASDNSDARSVAASDRGAAEANQNTAHIAQLVAERAQYVIPSILPQASAPEPRVEEDDEHEHAEPVHRVDPVGKLGQRKGR